MGTRGEDSVLVALSELRRIQDERRQEEAEEERRREEELRLAREAEARRITEEEERQRREEEEENRRAAVAKALLEREDRIRIQQAAARAEAEARVRAEQKELRHRAILDAERRARVPWKAVGIAVSVMAVAAGWAIYSMVGQARSATALAERRDREARAARTQSEILRVRLEEKALSLDMLRRERARVGAARVVATPDSLDKRPKKRAGGGGKRSARLPQKNAEDKASQTAPGPTISVEIDPLNPLVGIPEE